MWASWRIDIRAVCLMASSAILFSSCTPKPSEPTPTPTPTPTGLTVQLSVDATDTGGNTLAYSWRSTDGTLSGANTASATWTLPGGPGLHFAYVLVSNGKGGYTDRRVAVNTDSLTNPIVALPSVTLSAPAAPVRIGDYYRSYISSGFTATPYFDKNGHSVDANNIPVVLINGGFGGPPNATYPSTGSLNTNVYGEFVIGGVPDGNGYWTSCSFSAGVPNLFCSSQLPLDSTFTFPMPTTAVTDYVDGSLAIGNPPMIIGTLALQDGSPCGIEDEFFGIHVAASAVLLDGAGNPLGTSTSTNYVGDYSLPFNSSAVSVQLQCENAPAIVVPIGSKLNSAGTTDLGLSIVQGISTPVVSNMTASLNGSSVGLFLPPPVGLPSDVITRSEAFLGFKGLDSRLSACRYYLAIGAVKTCDSSGNFTGAVTFDDWKRAVKIGSFASGPTEFSAKYVNKADLNLTRDHHSISYGPTQTGAYVCNSLGPPLANPTQAEVDTVVDNAQQGKNLVACVAMDYSISPGVNNNLPFTRFLIFGPSGQLLPSVNLDGRAEKFVPGTCVVCHGGDHYAGKFPEDGSGFADIGAHFLPYDAGNFLFSDKTGLAEADQEEAIYNLNQNVLNSGPNIATQELIAGWYANGHVLDKNYVPISWQTQSTDAINFYQNVVARSCRGCHVAQIEGYNLDHYQNISPTGVFRSNRGLAPVATTVCGPGFVLPRLAYSMPNSLVTFDRFWLSAGTAEDQPLLTAKFFGGCQLRTQSGDPYVP